MTVRWTLSRLFDHIAVESIERYSQVLNAAPGNKMFTSVCCSYVTERYPTRVIFLASWFFFSKYPSLITLDAIADEAVVLSIVPVLMFQLQSV